MTPDEKRVERLRSMPEIAWECARSRVTIVRDPGSVLLDVAPVLRVEVKQPDAMGVQRWVEEDSAPARERILAMAIFALTEPKTDRA